MVRYVGNPRGVLSIHISTRALSGASLEIESESAPLLFISRHILANEGRLEKMEGINVELQFSMHDKRIGKFS